MATAMAFMPEQAEGRRTIKPRGFIAVASRSEYERDKPLHPVAVACVSFAERRVLDADPERNAAQIGTKMTMRLM